MLTAESRSLQMRVLFHQLFQSESWKLYRNLGVFSLAFALIHNSFAIFGMFDALPRTERAAAGTLLHGDFRARELLTPRGKELGNIVDGVVFWPGISAAITRLGSCRSALLIGRHALVFIFIAVVPLRQVVLLISCRCA